MIRWRIATPVHRAAILLAMSGLLPAEPDFARPLYLISIELNLEPKPVDKLRFDNIRGTVLQRLIPADPDAPFLGSLDPAVSEEHKGRYDLVIGNPPWASGTKLKNWSLVQKLVADIAATRLPNGRGKPLFPNEVLDLAFVWRAMDWARPDGQIALVLHACLLFQQGEGMADARVAIFNALEVTSIIKGVEIRRTRVCPISMHPSACCSPEEHSHRAPQRLISPANRQSEMAGTVNSTNTSSGKGWMSPDNAKFALLDCGLVVAIRRAKGRVIVVAKQLVFLETLIEIISRKRHLA